MTPKVKAAEATAVKKKTQKILHKILSKKLYIFYFLKSNEEEQETKQFHMDTVVAEEYIEYYADKYKELTRKHKFAIPFCKRTDENEIYNAIETTSNIPAGYYITAECTRDIEKFVQNYMENLVTKMVLSMQTKLPLRFSCMILNIF